MGFLRPPVRTRLHEAGRPALGRTLEQVAFRVLCLGLATYGLFVFAYKFVEPRVDYLEQYQAMYVSPGDHDADAPFAYRMVGPWIVHAMVEAGVYLPLPRAAAAPDVDPRVFFAAMLFSYLCLLGAAVAAGFLADHLAGSPSPTRALLAGLLVFASFGAQFFALSGLQDAPAWLLLALGFLLYVRGATVPLAGLLALSVVWRETLPLFFAAVAAVDLLLRRPQRRHALGVLGAAAACCIAYLALRLWILPVGGHGHQLSLASMLENARALLALEFFKPGLLGRIGAFQNVALLALGLAVASVLRGHRRLLGWMPHLLAGLAAVWAVACLASVGGGAARLLSFATPVWAALVAVQIEALGQPARQRVRAPAGERDRPAAPVGATPGAASLRRRTESG